MAVIVIGAGIGGLTAALSLHAVGVDVQVFEQARELGELGVGINVLPHAVKELAGLGLLPALERAGIRTRELIYMTRRGQTVWREPRGTFGGCDTPQFSIHRGKLHAVLARAAFERLGADHIHIGSTLAGFEARGPEIVARLRRRDDGQVFEVAGDALVGCDGIHSTVRAELYPNEGPPTWSGITLWRGAVDWPIFDGGDGMIVAGGMAARAVCYPIHADPERPDRRLTNWALMALVAEAGGRPPHRADWNRPARRDQVLAFVRDNFHLTAIDLPAMIEATALLYEYPNCDREPLPRWSFGRVTLLGDAAHPMYPVGSNGASQAILDARALARHLVSGAPVVEALAAYDAERRPATSAVVVQNRRGGNEGVIDFVEARAPEGFDDLHAVASHQELQAIVVDYSRLAGFAPEQVNRR
jgi:2-polyprenyl-6-methoxyphenol hydroxylase-like FAD-dependent oxidoreductase